MAISREKKEAIVARLAQGVQSAESLVFVNFHGIPANNAVALRQTLREKGVGYTVAKKTLSRRVLTDAQFTGSMPELPGEFGLAYGADPIVPAREMYAFEKKNPDKFKITGGVFEGRFMDRDEMLAIATIPDTPVLRGMFVNIINSPIQGLVLALNAIAEKRA